MNDIGLYEKLFPKKAVDITTGSYFKTLTAYEPKFTSYYGGIYEALLCRSSIHTFATHVQKSKITIKGTDKGLKNVLNYRPNPWQTTSQFLYRLATLYETDNNAFIVPLMDSMGERIVGLFPVKADEVIVKEHMGIPYLVFKFPGGRKGAVEYDRVGVLTKYQYANDLFGESSRNVLDSTLQMNHAQEEGTIEGIKSSARIRFLAMMAGNMKPKTLQEERKRFADFNLSADNGTGVMIIDEKYKDIKQIESKAMLVDAENVQQIKNNVYDYFGVNENILMNDYTEEQGNAYYGGKIAPFLKLLSEALTTMIYSAREQSFGNEIVVTSSRLEYASNETKINFVVQMFDRAMMSQNEGRAIFGLPAVEDGDKLFIRKEYAEASQLAMIQQIEAGGINNAGEE